MSGFNIYEDMEELMSKRLIDIINDKNLRKAIKPEWLPQAKYEHLIIKLYNESPSQPIEKFTRRLKIRIATFKYFGS